MSTPPPEHQRIIPHFAISEQGLRELEIWLLGRLGARGAGGGNGLQYHIAEVYGPHNIGDWLLVEMTDHDPDETDPDVGSPFTGEEASMRWISNIPSAGNPRPFYYQAGLLVEGGIKAQPRSGDNPKDSSFVSLGGSFTVDTTEEAPGTSGGNIGLDSGGGGISIDSRGDTFGAIEVTSGGEVVSVFGSGVKLLDDEDGQYLHGEFSGDDGSGSGVRLTSSNNDITLENTGGTGVFLLGNGGVFLSESSAAGISLDASTGTGDIVSALNNGGKFIVNDHLGAPLLTLTG